MARAPTTLDSFSAVAEPRRRELLDTLAAGGGELPVNTLVETLGWPQPQVSKHLAVLRQVGLVAVRRQGRERMYSVNASQIRTIHEWTKGFERFWSHQLDRIKQRAEAKAKAISSRSPHPPTESRKEI